MNSEGKEKWAEGSHCCTPESDQIKFPLAMRGVGELYAKDASLKISGQFIKHLRRRISRRMEYINNCITMGLTTQVSW